MDSIDEPERYLIAPLGSTFRKPEETVYIEPKTSPLARALWNVLTSAATSLEDNQHSLRLSHLCLAIDYNSHNHTPIKKALVALVSSPIIFIKESNGKLSNAPEWATTCFLSEASIKNGMITYSFSRLLKERIQKPKIYVKINLEAQKKLTSSNALYLYEITVRFVKKQSSENKHYPGLTTKWSLEHFRKLMRAEAKTYDQFKYLNSKVIKPYVTLVNKHTNINITPIFHPKNRKPITHIQFRVVNITNDSNTEEPLSSQCSVLDKLLTYEISRSRAIYYMSEIPELIIHECIHMLKERVLNNEIHTNATNYLHQMLKSHIPELKPTNNKTLIVNKAHQKNSTELVLELENNSVIVSSKKQLQETTAFINNLNDQDHLALKTQFLESTGYNFFYALTNKLGDEIPWTDRHPSDSGYRKHWIEFVRETKASQL